MGLRKNDTTTNNSFPNCDSLFSCVGICFIKEERKHLKNLNSSINQRVL